MVPFGYIARSVVPTILIWLFSCSIILGITWAIIGGSWVVWILADIVFTTICVILHTLFMSR